MGRTETIKERTVYAYLPTLEGVARWKEEAESRGLSLSKFVIEQVEDSIRGDEDDYETRQELVSRLKQASERIATVEEDSRLLRLVIEKLEKEARRFRAGPFLQPDFEGVRQFDKALVSHLRREGFVREGELFSHLGIEPDEGDAIKAVSAQLEILEAYGLVKYTKDGWRWNP